MGFDNECILNIQSLAGEYFCPVCRLLVYPNEAIQSQCTHLYCKPCLTYIVSTTRACPYDGYLVTEADAKPLIESNKALAETIEKIAVHCLYHRSGCTWQGSLSECTTHCAGCAFGNSPVVCNRCGTQIVHRQVQEHAQNCPGVQPQAQQAEGGVDATAAPSTTAAAEQNQAAPQAGAPASQSQPSQIVAAAANSSGQDQSQATTSTQPQAAAMTVPTPEQWYQQQQQHYQQYYQHYPGYDPYQQHYQHYDPYQQNLQAHPAHVQGQQKPQLHMQPHPQPQAQPQVRPHPQPQPQPQNQPQQQSQSQSQSQALAHSQAPISAQPQMQVQVNPQQQHPQMQLQSHPPQGQQHPQLYPQAQPHPQPYQAQLQVQPLMQQRPQVPHIQMQLPQPQPLSHPHPQPHPIPQPQPLSHPQTQLQQHPHMPAQPQLQSHPQAQPQLQPPPQTQPQPHSHPHQHPHLPAQRPPTHAVTGNQSYPQPQPYQQMLPAAPQQLPPHMHPQQGAPQQPPQMRPPQAHVPMQHQQPPAMLLPPQGQRPNMPPAQQPPVHPQAHHPGQPIHQHHGMNPLQQQHLNQSQAFPGQTPGLVQNQSHQPGPFMQQQHAMQPQLRPQGPPASLQQHAHANQPLQQNVPVIYGMQPQQSQNHAGRPVMSNHGVTHQLFQQSPGGPAHAKPMQPNGAQPPSNQNYPLRTTIRPQSSSEQQLGYVQHSAIPRSGSEAASVSASPAPTSGSNNQLSVVQGTMKPELLAEAGTLNIDAREATSSLGADSVNLRVPKSESDLKSGDDEEKLVNEDEGKSRLQSFTVKEISESSKTPQKDPVPHAQEDDSGEPVVKQMVKEEATGNSEPLSVGILVETAANKQEEVPHSSPKHDQNSMQENKEGQDVPGQKNLPSEHPEIVELQDVKFKKDASDSQMPTLPGAGKDSQAVSNDSVSATDRTGQNVIPQGQIQGNERSNLQVPLSRDPLQQPPPQNLVPTHDRMLSHSGYHERNLPQPQFPPSGLIQGNHQQLPTHYRPPHIQDRAHQRPPMPDQMLQMPPHQMHVPGQPPAHMRPQGHNVVGNLHQQGQVSIPPEPFQPPIGKQPHGSFHPEVPPGGFTGPGSSASFGRGPLVPQRSFELHSAPPQGNHNQGHLPPHHPTNPVDAANMRPGYFDGRQQDSHPPGSAERVPLGQSGIQLNSMKIGGIPSKELAGGIQDPSFPYGLQEERFKSLPEEGFNRLPEERFKPFPVEHNRRITDRREFEEDLKQFPGPGHLDAERMPKFESYYSSSRPLDRGPHELDRASYGFSGHDVGSKFDGGPSGAASRLLPPYQPGSVHSMRPGGFPDENMGRRGDPAGVHPDFLRPESGRHLPPRSPGREYPRFAAGNRSRLDDIDGRESRVFGERSKSFNLPSDGNAFHESRYPVLPSHLRRGEHDGPGHLRMGEQIGSGALPIHLRSGDLVGPDILPSHLRGVEPVGTRHFPSHMRMVEPAGFGPFPSHLRMGGPGNLPPNLHGEPIGGNLRIGEPGFNSSFPFHEGGYYDAGDESFDQSRKRKHGSMGWCRICKVDCETVEGLELHSQTREHQKMAMDMVLSIKQDNAKKQKLSSDDHISHEDTNKSRKGNFESRGNRH
ncbi:zinc finger protein [Macleaya cordata]|uniref:Zinc finger protein n=1 Tax=Macleaya cordata TaxID=56857 RepID=A0A200R4T7_MACCD|nr:zinc finger protein [Macleaya cordata]